MRTAIEINQIKQSVKHLKNDAAENADITNTAIKNEVITVLREVIQQECWSQKEAAAYFGTNVAEVNKLMSKRATTLSLKSLLKWASMMEIEIQPTFKIKKKYTVPAIVGISAASSKII